MAESNPGPSWYESVALQLSQLAFLYQVLIKPLLIRLRSWCCTGARGLSLLLNTSRHWHLRWRLTFTRSVGATHSADSLYSSKARRQWWYRLPLLQYGRTRQAVTGLYWSIAAFMTKTVTVQTCWKSQPKFADFEWFPANSRKSLRENKVILRKPVKKSILCQMESYGEKVPVTLSSLLLNKSY